LTTVAASKTQIASDLQFTGGFKFKGKAKVFPCTLGVANRFFGVDAAYIGFAGTAYKIAEAVEYMKSEGDKKPPRLDLQCVALTNDQRLFGSDNFAHWFEIGSPYYAIGSGQPYAMAAMTEGKTPIEACKIAAKLDPNTGMGYKKYEF
jgi:hypothetical protein